jgi:hypothetical protein
LRAHGRAFRERHGDEIMADYGARWSRTDRRGRGAATSFVVRAVASEVLAGLKGRSRGGRGGDIARDRRGGAKAMSGLRGDAWYAWRALRKRPAFALVVILTLARVSARTRRCSD